MNKKIIFSGFMAAILLSFSANAAEKIASKTYVDNKADALDMSITAINTNLTNNYSTTSEVAQAIATEVTTINGDVGAKADKVVSATESNLAGFDATGNLKDSGVSAASIATLGSDVTTLKTTANGLKALATKDTVSDADIAATAEIAKSKLAQAVRESLSLADTALQSTSIANMEVTTNRSDDVDTYKDNSTKYASTKGVATYVDGKISSATTALGLGTLANKDKVAAGDIAAGAIVDADIAAGTITDAKLSAAVQASLTKAESALQSASIDNMEVTTNKATTINETNENSETVYASVKAVTGYALPTPPTACSTTQCVLSVNAAGAPYWEVVSITGQE
ncbi:MAG: hypothetical protein LBJ73_04485 [Rickettsiales bacterium]|jgi:hypothetical protein|nr:hypothetical protein [Rickettsiales bacterium]